MNPPDLPLTARDLAQQGMDRASARVARIDPDWSERAYARLCRGLSLAPKGVMFTTEQIRANMPAEFADPDKAAAWGNLVSKAAKAGKIEFVDWVPSASPQAHGKPVRRWRIPFTPPAADQQ
jgi:hypothetical protein